MLSKRAVYHLRHSSSLKRGFKYHKEIIKVESDGCANYPDLIIIECIILTFRKTITFSLMSMYASN
jgi:hypothetical protein